MTVGELPGFWVAELVRNMGTLRTFEDLACYRAAREFRNLARDLCRTLPARSGSGLQRVGSDIPRPVGAASSPRQVRRGRRTYQASTCGGRVPLSLERTWKILNGYIAYSKECAADGVPESET